MKTTLDLNGDVLTAEYIVEAAERASTKTWRRATLVQYPAFWIWAAHGIKLPWFMSWQINDALDDDEILLCADDNTALGRITGFAAPEED